MEYSRPRGLRRHKGCWFALDKKTHEKLAGARTYDKLLKIIGDKEGVMILKDCTQHYDLKDFMVQRRFSYVDALWVLLSLFIVWALLQ